MSDHPLSLSELIASNWDPDPDVAAAAVIAAARVPKKWADLFYAVLRDECRRSARNVVRAHEHQIAEPGTRLCAKPIRDPSLVRFVAGYMVYRGDRMYTGERYVLKGVATVDEWRQRSLYLGRFRDGIDRTINECEHIIATLSSAGVACIDDLEPDPEVLVA